MSINLPQNDDQARRKTELAELSKLYSYNDDIGLPLIEAEGPDDRNRAEWTVKIFNCLLSIRSNLQKIYDLGSFQFMQPKPVRDIPKLIETLRSQQNPVNYFAPDPGFVVGGSRGSRPSGTSDYAEKIFLERDANNRGIGAVPAIVERWNDDKTLAYTFLAGPNPNQLQRWTAARKPREMDLTNFDLGSLPGFSGDNIEAAIGSGRVYFVDHSNLQQLFAGDPNAPAPNATRRFVYGTASNDWKYIYAPTAAFAVPKDGQFLLPIAIQCGIRAEGHQIFTPKDGYAWKMARVCLLAAHNNHHEVVSHLGCTHLLIDPIVLASRIHLHKNHPVNKLLSPHFEGTASINIGARTFLIQPERSLDRLIGSKIEKNYPFLRQERLSYSFRQNFPKVRAAQRGTDDAKLLPNYPYREDSYLLWDAIHSWVSEYVSIWYKSEADLRADYEIQAWANEINDRGKVRDFCLSGGGVQSRDDLIDILTMIIFTAGPQHAAVNFAQGSDMTFVPANPFAGSAPAPRRLDHTEQDFLDILPPMDVAVQTWTILNLLAGVNSTRLGDYNGAFLLNPLSELARQKFLANLRSIESKIESANVVRRSLYKLPYVHLLPSRIPASINI